MIRKQLDLQPGPELKPFRHYEGYLIGIDGTIWSCLFRGGGRSDRVWHALNPHITPSGYLKVYLCYAGKRTRYFVHRLVLEAFSGACPEGMEACHHPDPDPKNNHLNNLRWDTREGNITDGKSPKGMRPKEWRAPKPEDKNLIRIFELDGLGLRQWEIGKIMDVEPDTIKFILQGKLYTNDINRLKLTRKFSEVTP